MNYFGDHEMKKITVILTILVSLAVVVVAFAADFWANTLVVTSQGLSYEGDVIKLERSNPSAVLGMPDNDGSDETTFFSLGNGGIVVVKLVEPVDTGLEIYEATWGCNAGYAGEEAYVYVSADGVEWIFLGTASNGSDKICYNLPDKPGSGFMTSFDLAGECIQYVKVEDSGPAPGKYGDGFDVDAIGGGGDGSCQFTLIIDIDVKPGSYPSCFRNNGKGVIPVAIFGSEELDVMEIKPNSVNLNSLEVISKSKSNRLMVAYENINGDNYMDMVVKIENVEGTFNSEMEWATLTGELESGRRIRGVGDICIRE
jgi:hypothetical protein